MTVEELKSEAAKLPPADRFALAEWIENQDEIRQVRHAGLIKELQIGIDQADRGELLSGGEVFKRLRATHQAGL